MPYTLHRQPNHMVEITARLEPEHVDRERREIVSRFRRQARIPGFRPGKAPEAAVRARFAEEIRSELTDHLAEAVWHEVVTGEEDFVPLTRPSFDQLEIEEDGGFTATARLEVRPTYELPAVEDVELEPVSVEPTEAEIEEELEKLRTEHATWEPEEEGEAEDGMLVEADLHGEIEGGDDEPYTEENARFVIGDDSVPPEINEALQGAAPGQTRVAEKRFPEDDPKPERAGRKVTYTIDVKTLKRRVLPDLDDDLASTLGFDSLDELTERVRAAVQRRKQADRREQWRRAALDHLQRDVDLNDLPSALVQSAVREDLHRFAYSLAMQGVAPDSQDVDWQQMAARFEPAARKRVADNLVLEQLATEWDISTPEHEVNAYVAGEAQQLGVPPAEHKANLAKENRLDDIRHAARLSAVVDELIRRTGGEVE